MPAFAIDRFKVTNADWLRFIEAGGYGNRGLWSDADWRWISEAKITHPAFWKHSGDEWVYRRDPRVTLAWDLLSVESRLGVKVLSPEVVLLFKATGRRARDQADFDALLPRLADRRRAWLREALGIAHPGHRWLPDLG